MTRKALPRHLGAARSLARAMTILGDAYRQVAADAEIAVAPALASALRELAEGYSEVGGRLEFLAGRPAEERAARIRGLGKIFAELVVAEGSLAIRWMLAREQLLFELERMMTPPADPTEAPT